MGKTKAMNVGAAMQEERVTVGLAAGVPGTLGATRLNITRRASGTNAVRKQAIVAMTTNVPGPALNWL